MLNFFSLSYNIWQARLDRMRALCQQRCIIKKILAMSGIFYRTSSYLEGRLSNILDSLLPSLKLLGQKLSAWWYLKKVTLDHFWLEPNFNILICFYYLTSKVVHVGFWYLATICSMWLKYVLKIWNRLINYSACNYTFPVYSCSWIVGSMHILCGMRN